MPYAANIQAKLASEIEQTKYKEMEHAMPDLLWIITFRIHRHSTKMFLS